MKVNLVLSGGGVKSYAHLGVYKFLKQHNFIIEEIVCVSGGSIVAPFIALNKHPEVTINLFKREKFHKKLFPWWFVPDKFEIFMGSPSTMKVGEAIEGVFSKNELRRLKDEGRLHIMATRLPSPDLKAGPVEMLSMSDLKTSIAASSAIHGVFKAVPFEGVNYIDGGHWNNVPILHEFKDKKLPTIAVNLGYSGKIKKVKGRLSKIVQGLEIISYAAFRANVKKYLFEVGDQDRGLLFTINPEVWSMSALNFGLSDSDMDWLIKQGYKKAKKALTPAIQKI